MGSKWSPLLVAVVLLLAGCGATGNALARNAASKADDLARLAGSEYLPRAVPRVTVARVPRQSVADAAAGFAGRLSDLPEEDAWEIAQGACEGAALIEAGQSPDNAMKYLVSKSSAAAAHRSTVESLMTDLSKADSSMDVAVILGKAAFCEAAAEAG